MDRLAPDPDDAAAVLAFVLCPAEAFSGAAEEQDVLRAILAPMKREAIRRWQAAARARRSC